MELGKLLDHWRSIFLADHSADRCVADHSKFFNDHFANIFIHFWWTYFWGVLWGIGGLMYGLGMRYLGMSLGNSVLLGFTSAFGALVPAIYYNFHPTEGKTTFQ